MRTAADDAQDLAQHLDDLLAREYRQHGMQPGGFLKHVLRAFDESPDSRQDDVANLDMASEDAGNRGAKEALWAAHHIARAKKLHASGEEVQAYQELLEAYKCSNNLTAYILIFNGLKARSEPIRKAQASRHQTTKEIEAFAVARFRQGKFPSANKASISLTDEVRQYAFDKGKPLSEDRATKTIYEWLLRSMKGQQ